jgi:ribosome-binding protein aMBF1 (putative translation factor)
LSRKKLTANQVSGYHRRVVAPGPRDKPRATSRTTLGERFTEGARQLWVTLDKKSWQQLDLANFLGEPLAKVHTWLYGDAVPVLQAALNIEKKLGIEPSLFARKPYRPFQPPAAAA